MGGYNVADYVETADDLVFEWDDFFQNRTSFKPVIEKYKKCGYNVNQDVPGNLKWKNLYDFSPDAKVILTVRDNVDKWKESVNGYMHQEYSRLGNPGYFFPIENDELWFDGAETTSHGETCISGI